MKNSIPQQNLVILGSTGSIGTTTLEIIKYYPKEFRVYALVANGNIEKILEQAQYFQPEYIALNDIEKGKELTNKAHMLGLDLTVIYGSEAIKSLCRDPLVDTVVASIVGISGLTFTLAALEAGKKVLLANKESLVVAGDLCFQTAKANNAQIIPLDSEHNAMFQSLPESIQHNLGFCNLADSGVKSLVLTGSGGPFRERELSSFANITLAEALKHPNWEMGSKITIDSATMMNKGLEFIEACVLFNCTAKEIEVVLHPQSIIHSLVRYQDGSLISQMGMSDMTVPIAYALGYPQRLQTNKQLDLLSLQGLSFMEIDKKRYPCFFLAKEAYAQGFIQTNKLNAANEVAVAAFLEQRIKFTQIHALIEWVLEQNIMAKKTNSLENILEIDKQARKLANDWLNIHSN